MSLVLARLKGNASLRRRRRSDVCTVIERRRLAAVDRDQIHDALFAEFFDGLA